MLLMETYEPANKAKRESKAMKTFFHRIQLNLPSPRSQLWTVSTIAGVRRPRLERKMAPQRLMNSSKFGKAAARATERKIQDFKLVLLINVIITIVYDGI